MGERKSSRVAAVSEAKLSALANEAFKDEQKFNRRIAALVEEAHQRGHTEVTAETVRADLSRRMQDLRCGSD